jgi:hypothetical protein
MIARNRNHIGAALVAICTIAGCSAHESSVQGTVAMDGKPLTDGLVTFHPVAGGPLAYGRIQSDGRFEIRTGSQNGLEPGEYLVTVAANGPVPPPNARNRSPIAPLITPARYNHKETSGFRFSVVPGKNEFALELQAR